MEIVEHTYILMSTIEHNVPLNFQYKNHCIPTEPPKHRFKRTRLPLIIYNILTVYTYTYTLSLLKILGIYNTIIIKERKAKEDIIIHQIIPHRF